MPDPAPTDIAALIERLKSEAADYTAWDGNAMRNWDAWRKYIAEGGEGSWPRDNFEALLDDVAERNTEAATALAAQQAEIERLRGALSQAPGTVMIAFEDGDHQRLSRAAAQARLERDVALADLAARDETIRGLMARLIECADDLAAEIGARYPVEIRDQYPSQRRRYESDMTTVYRARAAIEQSKEGGA